MFNLRPIDYFFHSGGGDIENQISACTWLCRATPTFIGIMVASQSTITFTYTSTMECSAKEQSLYSLFKLHTLESRGGGGCKPTNLQKVSAAILNNVHVYYAPPPLPSRFRWRLCNMSIIHLESNRELIQSGSRHLIRSGNENQLFKNSIVQLLFPWADVEVTPRRKVPQVDIGGGKKLLLTELKII